MTRRIWLPIAVCASLLALPATFHPLTAHPEGCPTQDYDCSSGTPVDGEDNAIDSAGRCGQGLLPRSCVDVNGSGLHINYVIAQGQNCGGCLPITNASFQVYKIAPDGHAYPMAQTQYDRTIPGDGIKHGVRWNHGGVGWDEPNGTQICGLVQYLAWGDYHPLGPAGCITVHS